ncbi:DotA/TraY family protein [Enterobacter vonholyi]
MIFKKRGSINNVMLFFWALLASIIPNAAFADMTVSVNASDGILDKYLFKDDQILMPISSLLISLESVCLIFMGAIVAYGLLAGIMQTAHDGEMLGKRWSSMWIPIRATLATALLYPGANGKNAAVAIVLAMVTWGSGIADLAWSKYTATEDSTNMLTASPSMSASLILAKDIVDAAACNAIQNAAQDAENEKIKSNAKDERKFSSVSSVKDMTNTTVFGPSGKSNFQDYNGAFISDICGAVSTTIYKPSDSPAENTLINAETVKQTILEAKSQAINNMIKSAESYANTLATKTRNMTLTPEDIATAYNSLAAYYVSQMTAAGKNAYSRAINQSSSEAIINKGWTFAHVYYQRNITAYSLIAEAIADMPVSKGPNVTDKVIVNNPSAISMGYGGAMMPMPTATVLSGFNSISYYNTMTDKAIPLLTGANDPVLAAKQKEDIDGAKAANKYVKYITDNLNPIPSNLTDMNPLAASRIVGINTLNVNWTAYLIIAGILAVSSFIGVGAAIAVMPVVLPIFVVLTALGATLAFVIPFQVFITWTMAVMGYIVLVCEAILAVNIMVVAMTLPDGDGVVAGNRHGFMMIMSTTLRPLLLITGLVLSLAIMKFGYIFINVAWAYVSDFSQGAGGFASLIGKITALFVYANLIISMVKVANNLQTQIPDQVMVWFGVQQSSLLGGFNNATEGVMQSSAGAMNQAVNTGVQSSQPLVNGMMKGTDAASRSMYKGFNVAKDAVFSDKTEIKEGKSEPQNQETEKEKSKSNYKAVSDRIKRAKNNK